ncbi:hypothetical protein D9M73_138830 [compost metagenome]
MRHLRILFLENTERARLGATGRFCRQGAAQIRHDVTRLKVVADAHRSVLHAERLEQILAEDVADSALPAVGTPQRLAHKRMVDHRLIVAPPTRLDGAMDALDDVADQLGQIADIALRLNLPQAWPA